MEFDSILRITGRVSPYVVLSIALCLLLNTFANVQVILPNFIYPRLDHWCHVPQLHNQTQAHRKYIAIPFNSEDGQYHNCNAFELPWANYSSGQLDNWNWTGVDQSAVNVSACTWDWEYEDTVFPSTATSQWDLVCDKAWVLELLSPVYMAGLFTGSLISGPLADNFGRVRTLLFGVTVALLAGLGAIFAINEWMFIVFRYILGIFARVCALSAVVISMEIITPEYRSMTVSIARIAFSSGALVVAGVAYFLRDFRTLQFVLLVPLVVVYSIRWVIPESPRWLISKGRKAEARASILAMARRSGATVPEALLDKYTRQESVDLGTRNDSASVKDLFMTPTLLRWTVVLGFIKLAMQFVYFAVTLNMGTLFGDIFLNTILAAATEIPVTILVTFCLQKYGRKKPLLFLFFLVSVGGLVSAGLLIADVYPMANTVVLILVRCAASGGVAASTSLSGELFPSAMRQTSVSITSAISSLFSIFSPLVGGPMSELWKPLPSLVFAGLNVLAGLLCLYIPDTFGKAMPETVEEALALGRSSKKMKSPGVIDVVHHNPSTSEKGRVLPSLTDPGIQVGDHFYPIPSNSVSGMRNWAFEDDFHVRL